MVSSLFNQSQTLSESHRQKLDKIVSTLMDEGADDQSIQAVVNDYKKKYVGVRTKPKPMPGELTGGLDSLPVGLSAKESAAESLKMGRQNYFENEAAKRKAKTLDATQTAKVLNDAAASIAGAFTDNPVTDALAKGKKLMAQTLGQGPANLAFGPGEKGLAGYAGGFIGSAAAAPFDIGADVVNFAGKGEWQAGVNILLKSGALFIPAAKGVKLGYEAFQGTKAGMRFNAARGMKALIESGMDPVKAKQLVAKVTEDVKKPPVTSPEIPNTSTPPGLAETVGAKRPKTEPVAEPKKTPLKTVVLSDKEGKQFPAHASDFTDEDLLNQLDKKRQAARDIATHQPTNANGKATMHDVRELQAEVDRRGLGGSKDIGDAPKTPQTTVQTPLGSTVEGKEPVGGSDFLELKRGRPADTITLNNPVAGPSGAKLTGYSWAHKMDLVWSEAKQEYIEKRVSNWDDATRNDHTNKDIVHQFVVQTPDGQTHQVSVETAAKMLGYGNMDQAVKTSASSLKTTARNMMRLDAVNAEVARLQAIKQEIDALELPSLQQRPSSLPNRAARGQVEISYDGKSWVQVGSEEVSDKANLASQAWRERLFKERTGVSGYHIGSLRQEATSIENRLAKSGVSRNAPTALPTPNSAPIPDSAVPSAKVGSTFEPTKAADNVPVPKVEPTAPGPLEPSRMLPQVQRTPYWAENVKPDDPRISPDSPEFNPRLATALHRTLIGDTIDEFASAQDLAREVQDYLGNKDLKASNPEGAKHLNDWYGYRKDFTESSKYGPKEQVRVYKKNGRWLYDKRSGSPTWYSLEMLPNDLAMDMLHYADAHVRDDIYYVGAESLNRYKATGEVKPKYLSESEVMFNNVLRGDAFENLDRVVIPKRIWDDYFANMRTNIQSERKALTEASGNTAPMNPDHALDELGWTAPKHADVDAVREALGMSERQVNPQTMQGWMDDAKNINASEVARRVNDGGTASAPEQVSMGVRLNQLRAEMAKAKTAGDGDAFTTAFDEACYLADALDKAGSEAGRAMVARKMVLNDAFDEFSLKRILTKENGKALNQKQLDWIDRTVKEYDDLTKNLETAKAEIAELRANRSVQSKRGPRFSRETLDKELDSLLADFNTAKAKLSAGLDPEILAIAGKIALNYAKRGINKIDDLLAAVQKHIPEIQRQELIDELAKPGEPRTKSELAKALADLRVEAKKLSSDTQAKNIREQGEKADRFAQRQAEKQANIEAKRQADRLRNAERLDREGRKSEAAALRRDIISRDNDVASRAKAESIELDRLDKAGMASEAKALRDDIKARAAAAAKADKEALKLDARAANEQNKDFTRESDIRFKINEYQRRLKEGDYEIPSKAEAAKAKHIEELEAEMGYLRSRFESVRRSMKSQTSTTMKVAKEVTGVARFSTLSADIGQLLRQGRFAVVHGKSYGKGLLAAAQSIGSEKRFKVIMHGLDERRINGTFMPAVRKKAGLSLTNAIDEFEEGFVSKIARKLPLVGAPLERFQTAFMNTVRADIFDTFATSFKDLSEAELRARAELVNSLCGRSNLKGVPDALQVIMTSPRWTASRYELMARPIKDIKLALQGNRGAKENLKTLSAGMATYIAPVLIADRVLKAHNPEWGIIWDYESGDFLKIRIDSHVYDIGAGMSIPIRTVIRMVKGLMEDDPGFSTREALKTAVSTVNPGIRVPFELKSGTDILGFPDDEKDVGWMKLAPLIAQSVYQNIRDNQGPAFTAADALSEFIGIGANVYPKGNPVKPVPKGTLTKDGKPVKTKVFGLSPVRKD